MLKRYLVPLVYILFAIVMLLGTGESRQRKAAWFGRTILIPYVGSVRSLQSAQSLKAEVMALQNEMTRYQLHNLELINRLKEYTQAQSVNFAMESTRFVLAELIGYSGAFHERNLIINKGKGSRINVNDPVISPHGIIGKIILVSDTYSVILPLNNPQFQLPVMDQATSVQGILQSDINGKLFMNMIRLSSQISVGDTIVTSNLSKLFPKGFPVGRIRRIQESRDNLFISAEITPFAQIENLEHVFVLERREEEYRQ
ncbi:MAG: rod shape-determining protein MreC [Candidatus Cloacimonetes bacterium]|nr:rod shape-determining protein MreC [Candidatus Cloacimonadota bacterium]